MKLQIVQVTSVINLKQNRAEIFIKSLSLAVLLKILFGSIIVAYSMVKNESEIHEDVLQYIPLNFPKKIVALIIEDEKDISYLLSGILSQRGITTVSASSLLEAEHIDKELLPQIIFLDNHLPDGLGINYISSLKKRFPAAKIIMITAHDNLSDREKAKDEGVDFFITKPFSRDLIYRTVEQATI